MKIRKMLLILSFFAAAFAVTDLYAKTADLGFRIGKVVAAEITSAPTEVISQEQFPYPLPSKRLYAAVVLKMEKNRSLSSLDYSLVINGATVPCIAIVCNMASFVCSPDVTFPSEKDCARLLFVLDANRIKLPANGKTIRGTLKSNLRGRNSAALNIVSIGNKNFSDCTKIPADGALK